MDIDPQIISYAATIILGILATVFGDKYLKFKDKMYQGQQTTMQFAVAVQKLTEAIDDDRITQEEAEEITAAFKEIITQANQILKNPVKTEPKTVIKKTPVTRIDELETKIAKLDDIEQKIDQLLKK